MKAPLERNAWLALGALIASGGTLVCCVLPAAMVAVGAGAALAGLVSAVPQLVWMSEHKTGVFGLAAAALVVAGFALWRARSMPCPVDPELARACLRLRALSAAVYVTAVVAFTLGATFAFVLPRL
ncbi:MAG TPA: hypothetical protein VKB52_07270 [Rhodanobacteraceae bacterium]|nr:hypothetical protein [Rhodanobacteraceae bacterium]